MCDRVAGAGRRRARWRHSTRSVDRCALTLGDF